jgi:5-formyltetrahydrofolate cyclo-ligase
LVRQSFFQTAEHIACYLPRQHEFETRAIIETIWQAKKQCYLPVLLKEVNRALSFVHYAYGDALCFNRYSILEPANKAVICYPAKLDLVLMPLLAFDIEGHRLGSGGGYYDYTFAFLQQQKIKRPLLLGLAYSAQQADLLPADPWDIKLNGIVTEKGLLDFTD